MTGDARFEDADDGPVRLAAQSEGDLQVISAILQDSVFVATDMTWDRRRRRFAVLLNRFRWEDRDAAQAAGRPFERVRAVLAAEDVLAVGSQGIDRRDADTVLSLLAFGFEPGEDGTGGLVLTLAGDGGVRISVECVNVTLTDVTRPYAAPSGKMPRHET